MKTKTRTLPFQLGVLPAQRRLGKKDFALSRLFETTVDITSLPKIATFTSGQIITRHGEMVLQPPDFTSYEDYWQIFSLVDYVNRAVKAKNSSIWQAGFDTKPDKGGEKEKQRADELLKILDADVTLAEGTLYAIIFGNMWWEPLRDSSGRLAELKPLDPGTIFAVANKQTATTGRIDHWVQYQKNDLVNTWQPDELIHLRFNKYRNNIFGVGDLLPILFTVKVLLYMEEKLPEIVRKRSDPKLWYQVANLIDGKMVALPDRVFKQHVKSLQTADPAEDVFSGPALQKIEELYKTGGIAARQGIEVFLDHFKRKLQSGLAVPDVILGEGRTTTQATADEQTRLYHQDIGDKQFRIRRLVENDIFTIEKPPIRLVKYFAKPLTPEDMTALSIRLQGEVARGIIGPEFARQRLGYDQSASTGAAAQNNPKPAMVRSDYDVVIERGGQQYAKLKRVPRK